MLSRLTKIKTLFMLILTGMPIALYLYAMYLVKIKPAILELMWSIQWL